MAVSDVGSVCFIVVSDPRDVVGIKLNGCRVAFVLISDVWQRERQVSFVLAPNFVEELSSIVFKHYWEKLAVEDG